MAEYNKPNSEELLQAINQEEAKKQKGSLKIFLGMAAGVGKTYAMLEEAQRLRNNDFNLVVGIVDTHGRKETAIRLEGLKTIPLKKISYRGSTFEELDIDEIIALKPECVLIDELAHSNVPGSRHPKRWQDVIEILDNGIDVLTTLNVQHIESLKDVVENIAGISIQETVPDQIIEAANFIELVDITTGELLQRLKEGKVYLGEQSALAARHFFQEDRLTALREIVLRYAAGKIDHDLQGMVSTVQREHGWTPREKLLVAVSHSPHSQKLIRTTRRIAFNLDARWIALHVNNGRILDEADASMLAKNIALARDLGAEVITTNDQDVAQAIARVAKCKGVTQIIIGRPPKRSFFNALPSYTLLNDLARECSEIDIHIIRQTLPSRIRNKTSYLEFFQGSWIPYVASTCYACALSFLSWILEPFVGHQIMGFISILSILILNTCLKPGPIVFSLFAYAWIWISFINPSEGAANHDYLLFSLYLLVAMLTCLLLDRAKTNRNMLTKREESAQLLYEVAKEIAELPSSQLLTSVQDRLSLALNGKCDVLVKKIDNGLFFEGSFAKNLDVKEQATASWVFENNKEAGWSTSTLPASRNFYLPLKGFNEVVGVLSFHPLSERELNIEEKNFLYTIGQLLANYLEKGYSQERKQKVEQLHKVEQIHQTILNLFVQQLQKPLEKMNKTITDFRNKTSQNNETFNQFLTNIDEILEGLFHVLENISATAKLSSGLVSITKEKHSIQDLLNTCISVLHKSTKDHHIAISIEDDIPLLDFDFSLVELLICNLILNAVDNSPPHSTISIDAGKQTGYVFVSISDDGKGIPEDMQDSVFEKFYRIPGTTSVGFGLGLSVGKSIAEIHGGSLKVQNRPTGGAKFTLYLPLDGDLCSFPIRDIPPNANQLGDNNGNK